jgi:hypothetical protein
MSVEKRARVNSTRTTGSSSNKATNGVNSTSVALSSSSSGLGSVNASSELKNGSIVKIMRADPLMLHTQLIELISWLKPFQSIESVIQSNSTFLNNWSESMRSLV